MARGELRDSKKELFWRKMVRGQPGSGLSIRAWCRKHALREPAFYWWRRRLLRRESETSAPAFVPVCIRAASAVEGIGPIQIVLADPPQVRVLGPVDRQALADVLAVLTKDVRAGEAGAC